MPSLHQTYTYLLFYSLSWQRLQINMNKILWRSTDYETMLNNVKERRPCNLAYEESKVRRQVFWPDGYWWETGFAVIWDRASWSWSCLWLAGALFSTSQCWEERHESPSLAVTGNVNVADCLLSQLHWRQTHSTTTPVRSNPGSPGTHGQGSSVILWEHTAESAHPDLRLFWWEYCVQYLGFPVLCSWGGHTPSAKH